MITFACGKQELSSVSFQENKAKQLYYLTYKLQLETHRQEVFREFYFEIANDYKRHVLFNALDWLQDPKFSKQKSSL